MFISGIQQVGIGVADVHAAFKWYRQHFGMDLPIFEEAATAALMLPYTGGQPQDRHAILAINLQGGGGMEIWQYTGRTPEAPAFEPQLGDLGIYLGKIKCKEVTACFLDLEKKGVEMLAPIAERPDGTLHFYVRDPWGNPFEIVESESWYRSDLSAYTGGMYGATIGVSDMDTSVAFYNNVLGYDKVLYDETGTFDDFQGLPGGERAYRRVLLGHSLARKGPFSDLFGQTEIELVQAIDYSPRKIYENRFWGDLGFIHLCFDITGMEEMKAHCEALGHPFTVDSSGSFDMGEAAGYFSYIEDPDGALIEFVETHKIPILKKIGWYLNLRKRPDPEKPLPRFFFKALGMTRVKD
jgi:catechol 2,3-dioxygenase-like lactoylglutathione lyase family enzyme